MDAGRTPLKRAALHLTGVRPGPYRIRWYDPQEGQWLDETTQTAAGPLSLECGPFRDDRAARLSAETAPQRK